MYIHQCHITPPFPCELETQETGLGERRVQMLCSSALSMKENQNSTVANKNVDSCRHHGSMITIYKAQTSSDMLLQILLAGSAPQPLELLYVQSSHMFILCTLTSLPPPEVKREFTFAWLQALRIIVHRTTLNHVQKIALAPQTFARQAGPWHVKGTQLALIAEHAAGLGCTAWTSTPRA